MYSSLVFLFLTFLLGCNLGPSKPKDHLKKITLKLEKPISIKLTKTGKSVSSFNMIADVLTTKLITEANINWIVVDSNNVKILNNKLNYIGKEYSLSFDSGNIELPNPEENYKIVFIFSGKSKNEEINKTEIYNTLNQDEIDSAISDLQDRAN